MKLSCVTYSYLADPLGYPNQIDWRLATQKAIETPILKGIDRLMARLAPARLDGFEFWYPHVWPGNLTPVLATEVRKRLAAQGMVCAACAGSPGNPQKDRYASEERFQTALLLQAGTIAGDVTTAAVPELTQLCARYGVRVAYENHPEKDADEILAVIQGGNEWIGVAFDTGSILQHGGDAVQAIHQLGNRIFHVHLRDAPAVGSEKSVAIGTGLVDLPAVLQALRAIGYDGWLSIEIPAEDHDPTAEIIAAAEQVRRLWR
ncbi:MAG: sugar phosphate isomerase/epimerase [Caldilinea sp. CFX5]|nr:sugar phosphate isomerase/epimerase [Caldilinea sp. CFX5]